MQWEVEAVAFRIIGLVILVCFYGVYFFKMLEQRRKGIRTSHIGEGKKGLVRFIETTMGIFSCVTPAAEILSLFGNTTVFPSPVRAFGALTAAAGVCFFTASAVTMKDSWRAGVSEHERTELVTDGIYQISRNPAFLGFDLVYAGFVLMFFNRILAVISIIAVLMFHLQIVEVEEDFLLATFGDDYIHCVPGTAVPPYLFPCAEG